jgi:hypothetical protein
MMSTFFETSEHNGLGNMRLHRQLEESEFLKKIVLESKLQIKQRGVDANFIVVNTPASMTAWELKQLAARFSNFSPLCI